MREQTIKICSTSFGELYERHKGRIQQVTLRILAISLNLIPRSGASGLADDADWQRAGTAASNATASLAKNRIKFA